MIILKITGSGVCDRMQYINPKVYIDMNNGVIMEIYNNVEEMETFKGFYVFATDGSYVEILIHSWEFHQIMKLKHLLQMRISRDTKMDFGKLEITLKTLSSK